MAGCLSGALRGLLLQSLFSSSNKQRTVATVVRVPDLQEKQMTSVLCPDSARHLIHRVVVLSQEMPERAAIPKTLGEVAWQVCLPTL